MSDVARMNMILAAAILALGVYVWGTWPADAGSSVSALASPYCTTLGEASLSILGQAGYAEDMATGEVIFSKNADVQLPLASITKVMTVLVANDLLEPDDAVTITREALLPEGAGLAEGDVWRADELMDYTLVASVNDGAEALALTAAEKHGLTKEDFINRMNAKAAALGLAQTYFTNTTGLDVSESMSGAYGSAKDAARLIAFAAVNYPELMGKTTSGIAVFTPEQGPSYEAENTSSLIGNLPGAVASKTGFTDLAGGNLAIVFEPVLGRSVSAAVLGSTRDGRDDDMAKIAHASKRFMTRLLLCGERYGD